MHARAPGGACVCWGHLTVPDTHHKPVAPLWQHVPPVLMAWAPHCAPCCPPHPTPLPPLPPPSLIARLPPNPPHAPQLRACFSPPPSPPSRSLTAPLLPPCPSRRLRGGAGGGEAQVCLTGGGAAARAQEVPAGLSSGCLGCLVYVAVGRASVLFACSLHAASYVVAIGFDWGCLEVSESKHP